MNKGFAPGSRAGCVAMLLAAALASGVWSARALAGQDVIRTRPPAAAPAAVPPEEKGEAKTLKKTFEKKIGRKACGANLKTADAAGASRDSLFDHFCEQARWRGTGCTSIPQRHCCGRCHFAC